jgi:hypothetical protein
MRLALTEQEFQFELDNPDLFDFFGAPVRRVADFFRVRH